MSKEMLIWWKEIKHYTRFLKDNPNLTKNKIVKERVQRYKKYGYDCLVIWENELNNPGLINKKVVNFLGEQ